MAGLSDYLEKIYHSKSQSEVCAEEVGLCVSGGSDYHGRKKFPDLGSQNADGVLINAKRLSVLQNLGIILLEPM